MTFYIYQSNGKTVLTDGALISTHTDEGDAIDAAVRMAQEVGGGYKINYRRP